MKRTIVPQAADITGFTATPIPRKETGQRLLTAHLGFVRIQSAAKSLS